MVRLCLVSCSGGSGTPPSGGSDTGRCVSCAGRVEVRGAVLALDDGDPPRRPMRSGGVGRVLAGLRMTESVTLVTISVVWDTPLDCHFSAWSRPKPAPDPLPGPSVASGVIPTKGGRNGPVPATSGRASTGRWRSSPWKRCNHAPPRGRGQGAPRTARCIKTDKQECLCKRNCVREHPAPLGALRLIGPSVMTPRTRVREHPAPLGALRLTRGHTRTLLACGQGAPRTARCIKTVQEILES